MWWGHWGGANDGVVHLPIEWDSLFLLDGNRRAMEGEIFLSAPPLVDGCSRSRACESAGTFPARAIFRGEISPRSHERGCVKDSLFPFRAGVFRNRDLWDDNGSKQNVMSRICAKARSWAN